VAWSAEGSRELVSGNLAFPARDQVRQAGGAAVDSGAGHAGGAGHDSAPGSVRSRGRAVAGAQVASRRKAHHGSSRTVFHEGSG
jgi:hypothetical protein